MKKKIINFIQILKSINFLNSFKISSCDVLFFNHDADRAVTLNGKAYSPLIDNVREDFEARGFVCSSVALPWSVLTGNKAYGSPLNINKFIFFEFVFAFLFKNDVQKKYKQNSVYKRILELANPKLIISIGCPERLCIEAREKKIFHVEILHGIGYTSIPWGWSYKSSEYLPQGILALDAISHNTFKPLVNLGIEIKTIPHPFLKRFLTKDIDKIPLEWLPKKNNIIKWEKEILISLQWAYAGDHESYVEYENILENGLFYKEIEQIIKENRNILFRFRFHPVQLKNEKYKFLIEFMDDFVNKHPNTEWKESSFLPYPSIVRSCAGNISMSSMSCYDAAAFGVSSLMLCPTINSGGIYEDWFVDLEEEGYLQKSKANFDLIKSWVASVKKQEPRISNLDDNQSWDIAFKWMIDSSNLIIQNS